MNRFIVLLFTVFILIIPVLSAFSFAGLAKNLVNYLWQDETKYESTSKESKFDANDKRTKYESTSKESKFDANDKRTKYEANKASKHRRKLSKYETIIGIDLGTTYSWSVVFEFYFIS
jgi:biopolymer transport protein ExbB/TolQ